MLENKQLHGPYLFGAGVGKLWPPGQICFCNKVFGYSHAHLLAYCLRLPLYCIGRVEKLHEAGSQTDYIYRKILLTTELGDCWVV